MCLSFLYIQIPAELDECAAPRGVRRPDGAGDAGSQGKTEQPHVETDLQSGLQSRDVHTTAQHTALGGRLPGQLETKSVGYGPDNSFFLITMR